MGKLEAFDQEMAAIARIAVPPNETFPLETFAVRRCVADWVAACNRKTGSDQIDVDMFNAAIRLAGQRQVAHKLGAQLVFGPNRRRSTNIREVPVLAPPFTSEVDNVWLSRNLLPSNWQLLRWMEQERGMLAETAVHDGMRILGATALAARGIPSPHLTIILERKRTFIPPPNFLPDLAPVPDGLL